MLTPQLNGHSVTTIAESTVQSEHCKYSRPLLSDYVVGPQARGVNILVRAFLIWNESSFGLNGWSLRLEESTIQSKHCKSSQPFFELHERPLRLEGSTFFPNVVNLATYFWTKWLIPQGLASGIKPLVSLLGTQTRWWLAPRCCRGRCLLQSHSWW